MKAPHQAPLDDGNMAASALTKRRDDECRSLARSLVNVKVLASSVESSDDFSDCRPSLSSSIDDGN